MWLLAKLGVQSPSSPVTGSNCQCNVEVSAPEANSVAALLGGEMTLCKDPLLLLTLCHHSVRTLLTWSGQEGCCPAEQVVKVQEP